MSLTGDWSKLEDAIAALEHIAAPSTWIEITETVAEEMRQLVVNESFGAESDPYGGKWPALKRRRGRDKKGGKAGKILQDTGKLRSSIHSVVEADAAIVGTNLPYATFHQHGTNGHRKAFSRNQPAAGAGFSPFVSKAKASKRKAGAIAFRDLQFKQGGGAIPARPFLPDEKRGLPPRWREAIAEIIATELRALTKAVA